MTLAHELSGLLARDEAASVDAADRSAYAHDLWPRQLIATRGNLPRPPGPKAIVWPETDEELSRVLTFARARGVRVTPFGAGSAVTGGLSLDDDVIAVDMKRMRKLHAVDVAGGIATSDAGVLGQHLEDALERAGATLGHFPSSISCSTLGGWVATRSAGQCSGRYGKIEDMVVALEGVLPTGEAFRAGPPAAGQLDPRGLIVGNEGLYGFVTRATVRIWPAPTERRFAAFSFARLPDAWNALRTVYQSGLRPAMARLYDPIDSYIFKSGARAGEHAPVPAADRGRRRPIGEWVLRRVLQRPSLLNALNAAVGSAVFGSSLMLMMFEGTAGEDLDTPARMATRLALDGGGKDEGEAYARRWLARRHHVSYRQPPVFARGLWVDTMEVAAPWSRLGELYARVGEALSGGGFVMAHMSHAYPDGCSIYFTFSGASPSDAKALETYTQTWARALRAAHEAGGTISHHHGVGRSKRDAMQDELGAGVDLIETLRAACDPHGVMLQGALVPQTRKPSVETPSAPAVVVDAVSRLCTVPTDASLETVHHALQTRGLALDAPTQGTVATWLTRIDVGRIGGDPVDHLVVGYSAELPNGTIAHAPSAPRRAAGPDLSALFLPVDGKWGRLRTVTLRVRGNESGAAWFAPCASPRESMHPAIASWLQRAAPTVT